jgi:uncharacterized protein YqfA (UPF0365 family)
MDSIDVLYFRLWIQSVTTGAGIGIFDLLGMTFRKVNPTVIVRSKIMAVQAGASATTTGMTAKALEAHYLAGGNVPLVIRPMIAARKAKIIARLQAGHGHRPGRPQRAGGGADERLPAVIDCPARGAASAPTLDAVAKNGIQLKVKARVTVRANLEQLIGGATEETIIARVGEGIVSAIGSAETHAEVLENPDRSPRRCSLGGSIRKPPSRSSRSTSPTSTWATTSAPGCRPIRPRPTRAWPAPRPKGAAPWPSPRAGNDRRIEENRAKLVEAEAEVPKAMAEAFRSGRSASSITTSCATSRPTPTCESRIMKRRPRQRVRNWPKNNFGTSKTDVELLEHEETERTETCPLLSPLPPVVYFNSCLLLFRFLNG